MSYIKFENIVREYKTGDVTIRALDNTNFEIEKGELVIIVGPSGAGKTTTLNILGGMDSPTKGRVIIDGKDISNCNRKQLTEYRRNDIGFVFQFYNLVQNLTALENVELATEISKKPLDPRTVLKGVGLERRMLNFPAQLSGGEQQRVAIARAVAKNPKILLLANLYEELILIEVLFIITMTVYMILQKNLNLRLSKLLLKIINL